VLAQRCVDAGCSCLELWRSWLKGQPSVNCSSNPAEAVVEASEVYAQEMLEAYYPPRPGTSNSGFDKRL
jgi:hypothetical protein